MPDRLVLRTSLFCSLLILACGPKMRIDYREVRPEVKNYFGSERAISPYMWLLYKHGLPLQANGKNVYEIEDLFCNDYPRNFEIWEWKHNSAVFASPLDVILSYVPPEAPPGQLRISEIDTCTKGSSLCVEFTVDGLMMFARQVCYRFDVLAKNDKEEFYLFTSPPIVGGIGLRAAKITAFVDKGSLGRKKRGYLLIIVEVRDFVSGEKREAVVELRSSKNKKERR